MCGDLLHQPQDTPSAREARYPHPHPGATVQRRGSRASWGRMEGLASGRGAGGGQPGPGSQQGAGAGKAAEARSAEPAAGLLNAPKRLEFSLRAAGGLERF